MDCCKHLSWKGDPQKRRSSKALSYSLVRNEAPFGCRRSIEAWGPDGVPAAPELCHKKRACFEKSPTDRHKV